MRTLGVDLASRPEATGACLIEWSGGGATARIEAGRLDDARLVDLAAGADVVAVDAPLGWPDQFVAAVGAHHRGEPWPAVDLLDLRYRRTDLVVAARTGRRPLSASSDLLAVCAFRAARLQALLPGGAARRDGRGRLVEAYPAGALSVWGLPAVGYKGVRGRPVRERIVDGLRAGCPWLAVDEAALLRRDHDLDALLCALVGRAAGTGRTGGPPAEVADAATREGWIHLPTCRLDELPGPLSR